ncbi:MAG: carbohydrate ABC transporter permease [bacterium]
MFKSRGTEPNPLWKVAVYLLLVFWAVFTVLPLYWIFTTAFKVEREATAFPPTLVPHSVTLENFATLFKPSHKFDVPKFGFRPFLNSVIISLGTVMVAVFLSALGGYGFSRFRFPGRTQLLLGILIIRLVPPFAGIIPLFRLFSLYHLYDTYQGMILLFGVGAAPFGTWLMKGFFDTVPVELEEAAMVDGCSRWGAMWHVTFPLAAPGLAAVAVFAFREAWNDFTTALIMTSRATIRPYTVALYSFIGEYGEVRWELMSAAAFLSIVPVLISFALFQRHFVTGLTGGAVKG